jgi:hypothetical protein
MINDELKQAINTAIAECKDEYALAYLNAIDECIILYGEKSLKTQLLYILNNMQGWKGETARKVKDIFKKYAK